MLEKLGIRSYSEISNLDLNLLVITVTFAWLIIIFVNYIYFISQDKDI